MDGYILKFECFNISFKEKDRCLVGFFYHSYFYENKNENIFNVFVLVLYWFEAPWTVCRLLRQRTSRIKKKLDVRFLVVEKTTLSIIINQGNISK